MNANTAAHISRTRTRELLRLPGNVQVGEVGAMAAEIERLHARLARARHDRRLALLFVEATIEHAKAAAAAQETSADRADDPP